MFSLASRFRSDKDIRALPKYRSLGALPDRQEKKGCWKCSAPSGFPAKLFSAAGNTERTGTDSTRSHAKDSHRSGIQQGVSQTHRRRSDAANAGGPREAVREMPRDPDVVELFNKLAGPEPLPPR